MIGRRVKQAWSGLVAGTITRWEPLGPSMTDALVEADDGRRCWYASYSLVPIDDLGPLPSREEARERARIDAIESLHVIRAGLIAEWQKPWPGAEHGKAIIGKAIDGALADLARSKPQ